MSPACRLTVFCMMALTFASMIYAQQPATGLPPLGSFGGGPFDTINLANLDVHFEIPVFSRPGRGISFHYNLGYDSLVWQPVTANGTTSWQPVNGNWGWRAVTEAATGYVTFGAFNDVECDYTYNHIQYIGGYTETWTSLVYHDPAGGLHPFSGSAIIWINNGGTGNTCHAAGHSNLSNTVALDNSGYLLTVDVSSGSPVGTVYARGGLTLKVPPMPQSTGTGSITDANGNTISISSSGAITDTLDSGSSHVLSISGTPPSTYTYTPPSGTPVSVSISYYNYGIQTCFQVSGISEYSSSTSVPLVSTITLPDNGTYQIGYETTVGCGASGKTTGRVAYVVLPTGGLITYSYGSTNSMMADGSPSSMTRTFTQGTNIIDQTGTWTYTRGLQSGQQLPQTTTSVIDPSANETDLNFSGIYETSRAVYQGRASSGNILNYSYRCYNTWNGDNLCPTAAVTPPITWSTLDNHLNVLTTNSSSRYSWSDWWYDQYGNVTEKEDWDFGTGGNTILKDTRTTYNSSLCSAPKWICDHPSSIQVNDGQGHQYDLTNYSVYDGNGNLKEVSTAGSPAVHISLLLTPTTATVP